MNWEDIYPIGSFVTCTIDKDIGIVLNHGFNHVHHSPEIKIYWFNEKFASWCETIYFDAEVRNGYFKKIEINS